MRCVALAQEWRRRGAEAAFVANELTPAVAGRLASEHINVYRRQDCGEHFSRLIDQFNPDWIVIDLAPGVAHDDGGLSGRSILVVDDTGQCPTHHPDLILNQNSFATNISYDVSPAATVLRGLHYLLLRDEFVSEAAMTIRAEGMARRLAAVSRPPTTLLILGATDPLQKLLPMTRQLSALIRKGLLSRLHVVASSDHLDCAELSRLEEHEPLISLHMDVTDMPTLLADIDLAVTSGGTTVWELAYMGIPSVVVASSSMEKRMIADIEGACGFKNIGLLDEIDEPTMTATVEAAAGDNRWRRAAIQQSSTTIDGMGRTRVVDEMLKGEYLV